MTDKEHQLTYKEEVAQYTKKDAIHALLYVLYTGLLGLAFFLIVDGSTSDFFRIDGRLTFAAEVLGLAIVPLAFVPLFVILKKKGQTLRSVGMHFTDWKKSLIGGLLFVLVIVVLAAVVPGLLMGWQLTNVSRLLWLIVYLMLMAVWEDIVYVGYIQTRIYGLVKKDFWAIALGGFAFAAFHYPNLFFRFFAGGALFDIDIWSYFFMMTGSWIMMHVLFNHNFRYFRSIIPVTLFHFASNFALRVDLWSYTGDSSPNDFIVRAVTIFAAFAIPSMFIWLQKRKAQK